ncbi:hypothetical protein [Brevirhabdus sp.]|uniref:hypothetical protein n=1 Tax=Brevirhabdus sp. TaxID=2004514 RepID=UPI00405A00E3
MVSDLFMAAGIVLGVLAITGILGAMIEQRSARIAVFSLLIAGTMVVFASLIHPGGYRPSDVPMVFVRLIAWVM